MKVSPAWIVVALLVGYIFFLQMCQRPKCPPTSAGSSVLVDTQKIIEEFTSRWEKPKPIFINVPQIVYRDTGSTHPVPVPVFIDTSTNQVVKVPPTREDTMAIIQQFLSEVHYVDSFKTKYGTIKWNGVVARNMLQRRQWSVQYETPIITKTNLPPMYLYTGGGGFTAPGTFISAAQFDLGFRNRKGQDFQFSLMLIDNQWHKGLIFHQPIFTFK